MKKQKQDKPFCLEDKVIGWANKWGYKGVSPDCIAELKNILKEDKEKRKQAIKLLKEEIREYELQQFLVIPRELFSTINEIIDKTIGKKLAK